MFHYVYSFQILSYYLTVEKAYWEIITYIDLSIRLILKIMTRFYQKRIILFILPISINVYKNMLGLLLYF